VKTALWVSDADTEEEAVEGMRYAFHQPTFVYDDANPTINDLPLPADTKRALQEAASAALEVRTPTLTDPEVTALAHFVGMS